MRTIVNAFAASMLPTSDRPISVRFQPLSEQQASASLADGYESAVGHADTAALFTAALGKPVAENRVSVTLAPGATLLLGAYSGPRLPPGATELPAGAKIAWYEVTATAG